jgi:transposase
MHRLQELVRLHRLGRGPVQAARLLGVDRKTERKYRRRIARAGLLDGPVDDLPELRLLREAVRHATTPPLQERSSVEDFTSYVQGKLRDGLGPTAIHGLLLEERNDFRGSLSAVKRLCKRLKKAQGPREDEVVIPVHTVAGQQAQVDFGYVGKLYDPETKRKRKAWVFVMVLSHSRLAFARVVFRQDINTWLDLHRQAFAFFGGVPAVVVPDNLKAAVVRAAFSAEEMGTLNRSYRECARHYGFAIDPTPAYSPEKKGKVESSVKYLKRAFFKPRLDSLTDIEDANRRLEVWLRDTANVRIHGTTGRRPADVFATEEKEVLLGLPDTPFVPVLWHKGTVGRNCHATFRRRFYSVPWVLVGKEAWLRVRGNSVTVYVDDERVADHRLQGKTPWSTHPGHLPEGRRDFAERDPAVWVARADAIGTHVGTYIRAVMESDEVHYPLRRVQSIVRSLEAIPAKRAVSVVQHASRYGCYRPDGIRRIIKQGRDLEAHDDGFVDAHWAESPRFARAAEEFLMNLEVVDGPA